MKIYSLYYKETFVVAFPNREDTMCYGMKHYAEYAWDCNILEEYLSKSPLLYSAPYTPNPLCTTPITHNVVKPEPYSNVRAYWEEK